MALIDVTTTEMPFSLVVDDEENKIQIDEDVKTSLNSKTKAFADVEDISMMDVYKQAGLNNREIWELSKIDTEFNRNNLTFENMFPAVDALQESVMLYFKEYTQYIEND